MCKIFTLKEKGVSARKTEKVNLEISIKYFVKKLQQNIIPQYGAIKEQKSCLTQSLILLHIDFS